MSDICNDHELINDWHAVADITALVGENSIQTKLLGVELTVRYEAKHSPQIMQSYSRKAVTSTVKYGFLWACLGTPTREIVHIPEVNEGDRHFVSGGSMAVSVSGLRVVENFLDMGHFPFIHTHWLGVEPHTEVLPYKAEITANDEIIASECKFFQPAASPSANDGLMVDYIYRVLRPYTVMFYKSNPVHETRMDSIYLFVQPLDQEHCIAHSFLCYVKDDIDASSVRWFMQLIFSQDKPILENQLPKRLPLDPRAETPIRADAVSICYRRWLRAHNISYGAIQAAA